MFLTGEARGNLLNIAAMRPDETSSKVRPVIDTFFTRFGGHSAVID
jgi:hypothetical protein